ncbi:pentapeptide repeat-containing protein [Pseudooceanicola sp. C21-150M6]|uniref:pentapeptide repeat-containing protein n=1 Tax=Pseudooceanicola sp. C21-150M6 TaxID=3434355 RepID=UPI003D7F71B4
MAGDGHTINLTPNRDTRGHWVKEDQKITWLEWLGINSSPDLRKARRLGRLIGIVLVLNTASIGILVLIEIYQALLGIDLETDTTQHEAVRNVGLALAAIIGLPFIVWRSMVAQRQVNVAEEGLITDRINKAVAGLGTDKTVKRQRIDSSGKKIFEQDGEGKPDLSRPVWDEVTEPNLEVRIGALFALERISQDSERDHIQIIEILCAYIVENMDQSHIALPKDENASPDTWRTWGQSNPPVRPRADLDVALRILGRRNPDRLNIEAKADYRANLNYVRFRKLNLSRCLFVNADLRAAHLQGVTLWGAQLQGANLNQAQLQGADLWQAQLQGAHLEQAQLWGADLGHAQLQGATMWGAQLQGANLAKAQLQGAKLEATTFSIETAFKPASLRGAGLKAVDLSMLELDQRIVNQSYGDSDVSLPAGLDWPDHWHPKNAEPLTPLKFQTAWRAHQSSIGFDPDDPSTWDDPAD